MLDQNGVSISDRSADAGVRVSVDGVRDAPVSVLVNGVTRAVTKTDQSTFVPLRAYTIADIAIEPSASEDVAYNQATDRFVVYPGNVMRVERSVRRVTIFVGRLVLNDGTALANVTIQTDDAVSRTDPDGYFQIDGAVGQTLTAEFTDGDICEVTIPDHPPTDSAFVDLGQLECL